MAFVRSKRVHGNTYYQVVRNYRENGQHKQQVLCHLGVHSSIEEAIERRSQTVQRHLDVADYWEEEAATTKGYLLDFYGVDLTTETVNDDLDTEMVNDEAINEAIRRADDLHDLSAELLPLYRRYLHEYGVAEGVYEYHFAKRTADLLKERANVHQTKLNQLLEIKQEYF